MEPIDGLEMPKTVTEKEKSVNKLLSGLVRPDGVIVETTLTEDRTMIDRLAIIRELHKRARRSTRR